MPEITPSPMSVRWISLADLTGAGWEPPVSMGWRFPPRSGTLPTIHPCSGPMSGRPEHQKGFFSCILTSSFFSLSLVIRAFLLRFHPFKTCGCAVLFTALHGCQLPA